jgi:hypothetical protein
MRAATVIVAAIAAASILIALAFILSPEDSSKAVTKTVTEKVIEVPEPAAEEASSGEGGGGTAQFGGPTQCGTELSVENTSCELGEEIHAEYVNGNRGDFLPKDPETGKIVEFVCEDASEPVTCTSEATGAVVYFGK